MIEGAKGETTKKEAQGETGAAEESHPGELAPACPHGPTAQTTGHRQKGESKNAERLADEQPKSHAQRRAGQQGADRQGGEGHTGGNEGEEGQDHEGHIGVESVLESLDQTFPFRPPPADRNGQGAGKTGDRRGNARSQGEGPHQDKTDRVEQPWRPCPSRQQSKPPQDQTGRGRRSDLQLAREQNANEGHRSQIVGHSQGQEKEPKRLGQSAAENSEAGESKGYVRRGGDGPAAELPAAAGIDRQIDERRPDHAAQRRKQRDSQASGTGKLPFQDLELYFQPDDKKEHRHQPVAHPGLQGKGFGEATDAQGNDRLNEAEIVGGPWRIRQAEGRDCGQGENHPGAGLGLQKSKGRRLGHYQAAITAKAFPRRLLASPPFTPGQGQRVSQVVPPGWRLR